MSLASPPKTTPIKHRYNTKTLAPLQIPERATSSFQASVFVTSDFKIPMSKELKSEINKKSIEEFKITKQDF